jgi:hypothetical protein
MNYIKKAHGIYKMGRHLSGIDTANCIVEIIDIEKKCSDKI